MAVSRFRACFFPTAGNASRWAPLDLLYDQSTTHRRALVRETPRIYAGVAHSVAPLPIFPCASGALTCTFTAA